MLHVCRETTGLGRIVTLSGYVLMITGVCGFLECRRQNEVYVLGFTVMEALCLHRAIAES